MPDRHAPCCRFLSAAGTCALPALPGSAYCATHRLLCVIDPETGDGARAIRALEREARDPSAVPPEFAHLLGQRLPELEADDEPRDIAGCLDIAPRDRRDDDGEGE
ncbi:MAG: hypothetical protein ACREFC_03830 [Stellaceae bacterium]